MKREFSPSFAALFFASTLLRTILSSRGASMSKMYVSVGTAGIYDTDVFSNVDKLTRFDCEL